MILKKVLITVWLFCCSIGVQAACSTAQPIRLAGLDWESGQITTAIVARLLRDGYGCETEIVPGSTTSLETALMQDDIQIIAEQWVGRSAVMEQAERVGQVKVLGDTLKGGAEQGWYVPQYVKDANPGLNRVEDLTSFAHLFPNPEQPGKARLLNCPAGWVCEGFNTRLLDNTGLGSRFSNVRPGTGAALDAEIAAAIEQRKPVLFYYWQPSALMAKYQLHRIDFPAYDATCWEALLQREQRNRCVSGFPVSRLAMAVSTRFHQQHPELVAMIERLQFEPALLNGLILEMAQNQRKADAQAEVFLREYPEVWSTWMSQEARARVQAGLDEAAGQVRGGGFFPSWSVADRLNHWLSETVQRHGERFRAVSRFMLDHLLLPLERVLIGAPVWLVLVLLAMLGWHATRSFWKASLYVAGFYLIGAIGLWGALMQTVALLVASALFILLLGFPLGIWMARSDRLHRLFTPVLDIIQTMPSFVYLIPVLMLFGIGKVPALFATVVYAIAPLIRLTALGIRQVDPRMVEAAESFGSTRWQLLRWVQLPQARPSIMAGINQAVMMALGMAVVASMIGARGLGEPVLQAIQTLNIGQGVEAGAAIVWLAIVIDRITQAYGRKRG
ncbi:MAG: glycine betaine ABC transporter substrate-binding protein [Lautropia sp.]|nr:glycine betaine ABC transporter substrate-binding protein [Lautropia sp.]